MLLPVSAENVGDAYQTAIDGCREALAAHPTSLADDVALPRTLPLDPANRRTPPVKVCLTESDAHRRYKYIKI
jgi:hypothetical protein